MENLKKLSHQNFRSVSSGLVTGSLLKTAALCHTYCPVEIYNILPARYLIIDDSCGL